MALIRDLGLESRRLYSNPAADNRYIVRGGRPVDLPGLARRFLLRPPVLLVSQAPPARRAVHSPLATRTIEESLAEFVFAPPGPRIPRLRHQPLCRRRLRGRPRPTLGQAGLPQAARLEQTYGSLINGQILGARERQTPRRSLQAERAQDSPSTHGLQELIDALVGSSADVPPPPVRR